MAGVILPDQRLLSDPEVASGWGTPETFAHGAIVGDSGAEVVKIVLFTTHTVGDKTEHHEIACIFMPRSGFERWLVNAWRKWAGGTAH